MKKVVAFLEQYAEWVGLGVASLFLLWVVYGYVVSPDQLQVKVGTDTVFPEGVDPKISESYVRHLQDAMEASPGELANAFKVQNFVDDFVRNMSDKRDRMTPEVLAGGAASPRDSGQRGHRPRHRGQQDHPRHRQGAAHYHHRRD